MPIKPENRARYPANWKAIRKAILTRAGNACEQCKTPNRTRIARSTGNNEGTYMLDSAEAFCADTGKLLGRCRHSDNGLLRMTDIVLTISHADHIVEHCDESNLRALCQRCHLRHDAEYHKASAQATRRARLAVVDLFDLLPQTSQGGDPWLMPDEHSRLGRTLGRQARRAGKPAVEDPRQVRRLDHAVPGWRRSCQCGAWRRAATRMEPPGPAVPTGARGIGQEEAMTKRKEQCPKPAVGQMCPECLCSLSCRLGKVKPKIPASPIQPQEGKTS